MRTLTYYVASTLDGFIAAPDGGVDFFPVEGDHMAWLIEQFPETMPVHVRNALGIQAPPKHFDTVVMGRGTWEPARAAGLTSAYPHLRQYVCSTTLTTPPDETTTVVDTDPLRFVTTLKQEPDCGGLGIWLCGGGALAGTLLPAIDRLILKVNPVVIGSGIPLFRTDYTVNRFVATDTLVFDSGVVVRQLDRVQEPPEPA